MVRPEIERLKQMLIEARESSVVAMILAMINGDKQGLGTLVSKSYELAELEHKINVAEFMGNLLS